MFVGHLSLLYTNNNVVIFPHNGNEGGVNGLHHITCIHTKRVLREVIGGGTSRTVTFGVGVKGVGHGELVTGRVVYGGE